MKKTLLSLVAGASIGAGAVVTLPDGTTATAELPTASDIYNNEEVSSLKLIQTDDGHAARYIVEKTSSIEGVSSYTESGQAGDVESAWEAVSSAAQSACNEDPVCTWTSMGSARSVGGSTTATITGGPIVSITQDIPELNALKQQILDSLE
jgi:hypothetical protein